jgi:hypothetical protein
MRLTSLTCLSLAALIALTSCSDDPVTPALAPPTDVQVVASSASTVEITFDAAARAAEYIIERAPAAGAFVALDTITTTDFDDAGLTPNTDYRYRIASKLGTEVSGYTAIASVTTLQTGTVGTITLAGNITTSQTLDRDYLYVLRGFVKVQNGATLTIEDGTRIVGDQTVPGSALFIMRGARIEALGTAANPVVFTSQRAASSRKPGDWGGLIIVGNATINRSGTPIVEGSAAAIENGGPPGISYGEGTTDTDNSGTLRYVRVEFGGYAVLDGVELNSFTFAAVGSGTTVEYLQSMAGLDDSFEWFGGTVNSRYLVSYESGDDHFDAAEGFRGKNQFLIAMQSVQIPPQPGTGTLASDPQGFEIDGCSASTAGCNAPAAGTSAQSAHPFTMPVFANFTVVGTGDAASSGSSGGNGMVVRVGTGGTFINGIVARWPRSGISLRDSTTFNRESADSLVLGGVLFAQNGVGVGGNFDTPTLPFTDADVEARVGSGIESNAGTAASLFTLLPHVGVEPSVASLDWTPPAGSAGATGGLNAFTGVIAARAGTFIVPTAYRGAAAPGGTKWWSGWTVYYRN